MKKETKTIVYDDELRIEAYRFERIVQPFPNHFHEYYVIGFVEDGERCLSCKNRDYIITKGSMILFNPGDNHGCVQKDGGTFDYRGINIPKTTMLDWAEEVTGKQTLPGFSKNVIFDEEAACYLHPLHEMIMGASALCFVTWNFAVKILGPVKTSIYIYIVPVITVGTSALILHENITGLASMGTALTLAGLFLSESKPFLSRYGFSISGDNDPVDKRSSSLCERKAERPTEERKDHMQRTLNGAALTVAIIGAVNWGLIGFFGFNLVAYLFGASLISNIIYGLVGLCGLYLISFYSRLGRRQD